MRQTFYIRNTHVSKAFLAFAGIQKAWAKLQNGLSDGINSFRDDLKKGFIDFQNFTDGITAALNQKIFGFSDEVLIKVIAGNTKVAKEKKDQIDKDGKLAVSIGAQILEQDLKNIEKVSKERLGKIAKAGLAVKLDQRESKNEALEQAEKDLQDAKDALAFTVAEVGTETAHQIQAAKDIEDAAEDAEDPFQKLKDTLASLKIPDFNADIKTKLSAVGSFTGFEFVQSGPTIFQQNALDKQDRIIDELRKIRKNTKATSGQGVLR